MKKNEMKKGLTLIEFLFGIIILAVIGLGGYIIYDKVIKEQPNVEEPANPDDQQQTEKPTEPETPDKVEAISLNDKIVTDLLDKYNLEGSATDEFYTNKNITEDYIPNDFILGLTGGFFVYFQEEVDTSNTCDAEFSIKEEAFDDIVEYLFSDINYKHGSFTPFINFTNDFVFGEGSYYLYSDVVTYGSGEYRFCVNASDNPYSNNIFDGFIYQIPYKAEMINDGEKINIYFKTIFAKVVYLNDSLYYEYYRDYNKTKYIGDWFNMNLDALSSSEIDQLDSYVYSFEKRSDVSDYIAEKQSDGSYYLSGFKKAD